MAGISVTTQPRHEAPYDLDGPKFGTLRVAELFNGDRRFEAGVYLSDGFLFRQAIERSGLQAPLLGDLATIWQPSRLKGIRVGREGVPFLAATQVFDVWPTPRKWLATSKTPQLAQRIVEPGWILVTCSGTVGTCIITSAAHSGYVVSHDLLRVQIPETDLRDYVYCFLRTWFGRAMMRGSHYGNIIKHLEVPHLAAVPIPVLDAMVSEIHDCVTDVLNARDRAYRLDMLARGRFADALTERPGEEQETGYLVPSKEVFGGRRRIEAAAHSPAARFVLQTYERNADSVVALGTLARVFLPARFRRIYGDVGVTYLDSEPIFKVNPEVSKRLTPATDIDFSDYKVRCGWLLLARSGQVYGINGQAILANEWHEGKVVTEHIMRIVPNHGKVRPGYLQTVLSHPTLGQPLVISRAFGTSVPELAPEDIERLPIPCLDGSVEGEIADAAEQASALRYRADVEENAVVQKLEDALSEHFTIGDKMPAETRKPGRPPKHDYDIRTVPKIPDTPENVAKAILRSPPDKK